MTLRRTLTKMAYRRLPTQAEVEGWLCETVMPAKPMYLPHPHHNAFKGVLVGPRPCAVFDEEIVIRNLIRMGLSDMEAVKYLTARTRDPAPGWPIIVRSYELYEDNNSKS